MNTEKLILKGVETKLIGGRTFFKVESLNEHFDVLVIHESDWVQVEDEAYVVLSDVNFDNATDNEIQRKSEVVEDFPVWVNAETEVIEPEVVEPEIVAPEVIVAETSNKEIETEKE